MPLPSFSSAVPNDGYHWWYVDALSDDRRHALTLIAFLGSVFSPYYARARRRRPTPALDHCALNVVLYGTPARWCMTERDGASVTRSGTRLTIGPSALEIRDGQLVVDIDEVAVPWPTPLRGRLRVDLPKRAPASDAPLTLDAAAHHRWWPIAPRTRLALEMRSPPLAWSGTAYLDANAGAVPLERSFRSWSWSRGHAADGTTRVRYDVCERDGHLARRTLLIDADGDVREGAIGRIEALPPTRWWRIGRETRLADEDTLDALETLEDTPFYARSRYVERGADGPRQVIHESLDLARFDLPLVRAALPFRMPRRAGPIAPRR